MKNTISVPQLILKSLIFSLSFLLLVQLQALGQFEPEANKGSAPGEGKNKKCKDGKRLMSKRSSTTCKTVYECVPQDLLTRKKYLDDGYLDVSTELIEDEILEASCCGRKDLRYLVVFVDEDGDGHATGTVGIEFCKSQGIPPGYTKSILPIGDCAPGDASKWHNICKKGKRGGPNYQECVGAEATNCGGGAAIEYDVFPNPVNDRLNIAPTATWNEHAEIKLIDQYSRVVRSMQVPNAVKGQTFTINTSDLKPGLYQLTIRRGEMIESQTIAIKL